MRQPLFVVLNCFALTSFVGTVCKTAFTTQELFYISEPSGQILIDYFVSYNFISLLYSSNNKNFYLFLDMNIGNIISQLRDKNNLSQSDLAEKSNVSRVMIGKYERGEAIPSIDAAKKMSDALGVSLDFLVGESKNASFDKRTLQRIQDLELLEESKKETLFDLIDTYIRDFKTRGAYSSI